MHSFDITTAAGAMTRRQAAQAAAEFIQARIRGKPVLPAIPAQ